MSSIDDDIVTRWVSGIAAVGFSTAFDAVGPLPAEHADTILNRVAGQQLGGLLVHAIEQGTVGVTPEQRQRVATLHHREMEHALRTERAAVGVSRALAARDIDHTVLKGVALAHTAYESAALRPFSDADVLVDPPRFTDAIKVLGAIGAVRPMPEVRPGHDARFTKDVPVLYQGATIDLHRTLIRGPLGVRIPVRRLVARRRAVPIADYAIPALDAADSYLHAALTAGAADDPPRLITLRDLAELEAAADFDPELLRLRAAEWGIEAAVARAVGLVASRLRPDRRPVLTSWSDRFVPRPYDRGMLATYLGGGRSYRSTLATVIELRGLGDRAAFMRALIAPQRTYRIFRSWTWRRHVRRGLRQLRGGR